MKETMKLSRFDKYDYYRKAVQDPMEIAAFLDSAYREAYRVRGAVLREDFCGTFALCCEWVKRHPERRAIGVDKDSKPLEYGLQHHLAKMSQEQRERIQVLKADVLGKKLPKADIVCALNFSYFAFHDRKTLRGYFEKCRERLSDKGLLVLDCLSGTESLRVLEDEVEYEDFTYFWEQASFDPITRRALFHIHFQRPGEKRRERVFTYDWRLWTVPELRDLLEEVGFGKSAVYWERDGRRLGCLYCREEKIVLRIKA